MFWGKSPASHRNLFSIRSSTNKIETGRHLRSTRITTRIQGNPWGRLCVMNGKPTASPSKFKSQQQEWRNTLIFISNKCLNAWDINNFFMAFEQVITNCFCQDREHHLENVCTPLILNRYYHIGIVLMNALWLKSHGGKTLYILATPAMSSEKTCASTGLMQEGPSQQRDKSSLFPWCKDLCLILQH